MGTSAITVNTSITQTSSLFLEKWRSAWHRPRESLQEGVNMAGLMATWKEALHTLDMPFYRVGALKWDPGYDICGVITPHTLSTRSSG